MSNDERGGRCHVSLPCLDETGRHHTRHAFLPTYVHVIGSVLARARSSSGGRSGLSYLRLQVPVWRCRTCSSRRGTGNPRSNGYFTLMIVSATHCYRVHHRVPSCHWLTVSHPSPARHAIPPAKVPPTPRWINMPTNAPLSS